MIFKFCVILVITCVVSQQCVPTVYGGHGDVCQLNSTHLCKQFLKCNTGRCEDAYPGSKCVIDQHCTGSSQGVQCIEGRCTKQRYNGYPCEKNTDCYGNKCTDKICAGLGAGAVCDPTNNVMCAKGFYCSTSKICVAQRIRGQECNDYNSLFTGRGSNYNVICPGGTKCVSTSNPNNHTCEDVYQRREGESCSFSEQCHPPLICDTRSGSPKCLLQTQTKPCPSRSNPHQYCFFYENCECEKCIKQFEWNDCDYQTAFDRWNKCWRDSNCPFDQGITYDDWFVDSFDTNTCLSLHCRESVRDFMCCAMSWNNEFSMSNNGPLGCSSRFNLLWLVMILILTLIPVCAIGIGAVWLIKTRRDAKVYEEIK